MKKKIHKVLLAFTLLLITPTLFSQNTFNSNEASNFLLYPSGGSVSKARIHQIIANTSSHANRSISATNHAPIANNDTVYLCKNSTITIHVQNNDSDPDGDALTTSIYATIGNGVFTLNGTSINYTPHSGYIGTDTVIYIICDNGTPSLCDTAIAFIHIVPSYTTNLSVSICNGDSAFIDGAFHTMGGVFTKTLTATGGCDSIIVTSLTVNANPAPVITPDGPTSFCQGDSVHLIANANTSYLWSTGAITQSISVFTSGNYYVTVKNASGCSTKSATITVTVIPSLTITPSSTSICAGGSTTLTASGALNYTWTPAATLNTNTGNVVIASPPTTTNYTLVGASGLCVASATINVTVNPLPIISITPSATTICAGNSTTLTASGALTYTWVPTTNLSIGTGSVVIATPTTTATYTVSGSDANCTGTQTAVVTVTPLPVIVITPASPTICVGNSTVLTASGASTYTWLPAIGLSTTTGSVVTANPANDQTYTITGTSGLCSATQTAQVTVAPNPTITITSSSTLICIGTSATLTAAGADTYTWTPIASLSVNTGSVVVATPTTTITYSVTGTLGICPSNQTVLITVITAPTPTITAGGPTTFCQGDSVKLTSSVGDSYLWSTGATTQTITASASGDYTVTVFNICGNGTTSFSVTVNPLPIATITPNGPTTFCQGDSVKLVSSVGSSYVWSTTATTQTITVYSSGTFSVKVTDANSCSATSATLSVVVNSLPVISITPSSTTICAGDATTLTASGALTYTWAPSTDLSTSTGSVVVATPTSTATYTVSGSDATCTGTQTAVVTVTPLPVIVITPASPTICAGNSTVLTASGASTYTWSPATGLSATTGSTVTANPASDQTYIITGANLGCTSTQTTQVTVAANPTISITPSSTLICVTTSATLTAAG
ncbi:MAG: Ig-like domain-containing protein, partial [Bacteroidia bacterium]